mmetsp:Transcript_22543/g.55950  ORF Transcript_22543/g.55950 Transcript_22543/m.55950 type:complete len:198 (-) Transcript_22543:91-684(-)
MLLLRGSKIFRPLMDSTGEYFEVETDHGPKSIRYGLAAALVLACRIEGVAWTLNEAAALCGLDKDDIYIKLCLIEKHFPQLRSSSPVPLPDVNILRYCRLLKLPEEIFNLASAVTKTAQTLNGIHGRSPASIVSTAIFVVCDLKGPPFAKSASEIVQVTQISELTLRSAYMAFRSQLDRILPKDVVWAKKPSDLMRP